MNKKRTDRFTSKTLAPEEPHDTSAADPAAPAEAAVTEPATDTPVTHKAVCRECDAHVTYALTSSGHGFMVLETSEADVSFGQSDSGLPLCPRGHGEMLLADEQIPVADAITQAAELQGSENGHGTPAQRALFDTRKPFNLEGALEAIAEKNRAVQWAHDRYDRAKTEASDARKTWEREAKQLQDLIVDLNDKREARAPQVEDAATDAVAVDPTGEVIEAPVEGDTGDEAFTSDEPPTVEAPADVVDEAHAQLTVSA